jgi:hypothetical protein
VPYAVDQGRHAAGSLVPTPPASAMTFTDLALEKRAPSLVPFSFDACSFGVPPSWRTMRRRTSRQAEALPHPEIGTSMSHTRANGRANEVFVAQRAGVSISIRTWRGGARVCAPCRNSYWSCIVCRQGAKTVGNNCVRPRAVAYCVTYLPANSWSGVQISVCEDLYRW